MVTPRRVTTALLSLGQRSAWGVTMLASALIPIGDMTTVLSYDGSTAAAFGIHCLTAVSVALTGVLLLRERANSASRGRDHRRSTS